MTQTVRAFVSRKYEKYMHGLHLHILLWLLVVSRFLIGTYFLVESTHIQNTSQ